jgi:hypothetical protein
MRRGWLAGWCFFFTGCSFRRLPLRPKGPKEERLKIFENGQGCNLDHHPFCVFPTATWMGLHHL